MQVKGEQYFDEQNYEKNKFYHLIHEIKDHNFLNSKKVQATKIACNYFS